MVTILFGVAAFALFFLSDFLQVASPKHANSRYFFAGTLLLALTTAHILYKSWRTTANPIYQIIAGAALAVLFCILLLYTLFFALPYDATYKTDDRSSTGMRPVVTYGVYALCRHPGILWFAAMYGSLYLALGGPLLRVACPLFSALNLLYAALQDIYVFPRQFTGYGDYKRLAPFLIPTRASIRRCVKTWPTQKARNPATQGGSDEI